MILDVVMTDRLTNIGLDELPGGGEPLEMK